MTTDAQTWVYPAPGAAAPPVAATSNFGPVFLGDSMILEWMPSTTPEIDLTCISESGVYTTSIAAKLVSPPLTFPFKDAAIAKTNGTEKIFCHFFFTPSLLGNTVTWEFVKQDSDKAVTWSSPNTSTNASSKTSLSSTMSSGTPSTSNASSPPTNSHSTTTTSSSPSSTSSSNTPPPVSSGLSPGAGAGIGVGAAVVVLGLAALAFLLVRKKRRRENRIAELPNNQTSYFDQDRYIAHEKDGSAFASVELEGSATVHQLP